MKPTDYNPRAAGFDTYLIGKDLVGIEVGCDAGAHAESLLTYCDIKELYLIDNWENEFCKGYCEGRLKKCRSKIKPIQGTSEDVAKVLSVKFDFIYIDILHDYLTVKQSLEDWWPTLKEGGVLGYRNYSTCRKAIDEFVVGNNIKSKLEDYYNEIILFK